jgi:hypothetical protein
VRSSVGYDLTETVRAAILQIPDTVWVSARDQDGSERPNGHVEITGHLDLTGWPEGSRGLVRRERAHPGAQLSFTDVDGHPSRRSSPTSPARSPTSSVATALAPGSRTTSATTRTPACATCRSATSNTTASGWRSS